MKVNYQKTKKYIYFKTKKNARISTLRTTKKWLAEDREEWKFYVVKPTKRLKLKKKKERRD